MPRMSVALHRRQGVSTRSRTRRLAFSRYRQHTGEVIALTEAQVWTVIAVLAATLVGFVTLTITLLMRTVTAQVEGLRNEMIARFEGMDHRFDALDRDVQALTRRVFDGE